MDEGFDVVADQAHAFHAFNATFGGLVGLPDFEALPGKWVESGFGSEDDDGVQDFVGDRFGFAEMGGTTERLQQVPSPSSRGARPS